MTDTHGPFIGSEFERPNFVPSAEYLAETFGVDVTTARRWIRRKKYPRAVAMLLSADLGVFDPRWAGWRVRAGVLRSPEGFEVTVGDVLSFPFMRIQIATYQAEARSAREPQMDEQPSPESWDAQEHDLRAMR